MAIDFSNRWVYGSCAFIIGILLGWALMHFWPGSPVTNGSFSTYTKDTVGKITFTVGLNTTGVISSELIGTNSKSVRVHLVGGTDIQMSDWLPASPPDPNPPPTIHSCSSGKPIAGWAVRQGTYEIYVTNDYRASCTPPLSTKPYTLWPTVITGTSQIVLPGSGGGPRFCPTDIYWFSAACTPAEDTKITIMMQAD